MLVLLIPCVDEEYEEPTIQSPYGAQKYRYFDDCGFPYTGRPLRLTPLQLPHWKAARTPTGRPS